MDFGSGSGCLDCIRIQIKPNPPDPKLWALGMSEFIDLPIIRVINPVIDHTL